MALQVWLPLNGDLHNQGLAKIIATNTGAIINNNGKIGKCYDFNNSTVGIMANNSITLGTTFSISCWIKINNYNQDWANAFKIYKDSYDYIGLCMNQVNASTNQLGFHIYKNNGSNARTGVSDGYYMPLTLGIWYHLCFVVTPTSITTYQNGINIRTVSITTNFPPISNYNLSLGKSSLFNGLECSLNDMRLYNHALSEEEVKKISQGLVLHYKLNNNGLGGNNLALHTHDLSVSASKNNLNMGIRGTSTRQLRSDGFYESKGTASWHGLSFWANQLNLVPGTKITYSFYIYGNGSSRAFSFYPMMFNSAGTRDTSTGLPISVDGGPYTTVNSKAFSNTTATTPEYHYVTFEWNQAVSDIITNGGSIELSIQVHGTWNSGDWACIFAPKIEVGEIPTPWCPHISELSFDSNTIYDSSGYNNNGTIIGSSENIILSPKYNCAIKFDGSSSTVKILENKWMAQHATEMTINIWVKNSSWSNGANMKFFSCTESGGFNCEAGNSGYVRFPIYVCTNAEQTTYAYKYDSKEIQASALTANNWNMITFVYNSAGTKTYINGQLHHTYTNTSYGIRFNTNARLFLGCEANTATPSSPYYNGQMSDFRLYYTALTAEQIKELYKDSLIVNGTTKIPRDLE